MVPMKIAMPVAPIAPRASMTTIPPANAVAAAAASRRLVRRIGRDCGLTERDMGVSEPLALLSLPRFAAARNEVR